MPPRPPRPQARPAQAVDRPHQRAARLNGTTYSRLIAALKKANILLNRKMLADIAVRDPKAFAAVVAQAK